MLTIDKTDFPQMYREFEDRYNHLPVQMSRAEAFANALRDRLIDKETYDEARRFYGELWFYVGD